MIEFKCPKCDEKISVPDSQAGELQACPACRDVVVVPYLAVESGARRDSGSGTAGAFLYQAAGFLLAVLGVVGVGVRAGIVPSVLVFVCGMLMIGLGGLAWRLDDLRQDRRDERAK